MTNLEVYRGDNKTYTLTFAYSTGTAINLSGTTIYFTVKNATDYSIDDTNALISKDVTSHTSPAAGITEINLLATDTNINPTRYKYDIKYKNQADEISTVMTGEFKVLDNYTRRA